MIKIKIADFVIAIDNKYTYLNFLCKNYVTDEENIDFTVSCTAEEIEEERKNNDEGEFSDGYVEGICTYRKICLEILKYDAFVMHSAVIGVGGKAYAFAAKSGTGKSTHIALWHKYLGEENVTVINGDKPILRYKNGEFTVYGTPWCGKENWSTNTSAPLNAICFIERSETNHIEKIDKSEAATRIMRQILIPEDPEGAIKTLELMDKMINKIPTYVLGCNISVEAAKIAYEAMRGE